VFQESEISTASVKKSVKKKPPSLRNSTSLNNSESSLVTTTTQVPAKDVPSVASNTSTTETVNTPTPAPAPSTAVKSETMDYTRSDSTVQSSVLPPSQPTKVLNVLLFILIIFLHQSPGVFSLTNCTCLKGPPIVVSLRSRSPYFGFNKNNFAFPFFSYQSYFTPDEQKGPLVQLVKKALF